MNALDARYYIGVVLIVLLIVFLVRERRRPYELDSERHIDLTKDE